MRLRHLRTRSIPSLMGTSEHFLIATLWMTYSYGLSFLFQGAYFALIARALGANGFGAFAAALAVVSTLAPFATLGSGHLLLMYTSRDRRNYSSWYGTACRTTWVVGGTLCLGVLVATLLLPSTPLVLCLPALALAECLLFRFNELSAQCFQSLDRMSWSANILLLGSLVRLAAVGVFMATVRHGTAAHWSIFYLTAAAFSGVASLLITQCRLGPPEPPLHLDVVRRRGIFFSLGVASKTIYGDIDKIMLAVISGATAAGIYTAAYRVVAMGFTPVVAAMYTSNTRFFRAGATGLSASRRLIRRLIVPLAVYVLIVGIAEWIASPLLPVVIGKDFDQAASALRWLAFLPLVQAVHYVVGDALMGSDRQALRSSLQAGMALFNVVLNLFLIPAFSWRGAAVASYVTEGTLALLMGVAFSLSHRRESLAAAGSPSGATGVRSIPAP